MRRRPPRTVDGRAILAVVALYALLLQAFLGFAAPVAVSNAAGAVLCAEHAGDVPADGKVSVACHPCCTTVHVGTLAPPPPTAFAASWPTLAYAHVAWRPEADLSRTGPPVFAASARGPPAA